jgi:DNA-directed RNA polymerase specialized sigma subunit
VPRRGEAAEKRLEEFAEDWRQRQGAHEAEGDSLRHERDEAILRAYRGGASQPKIAAILGMSQQRVSQVVRDA